MTDIALIFDTAAWAGDIAIADGGLATDDGLRTAIIVSLFSDARAREDDVLPDAGADRRGWWGDLANVDPNDRIGSRLWLLARAKLTPATAIQARDIVREALDWLVGDGVVRALDVETMIFAPTAARPSGALGIGIAVTRPDGPARQRFDFVWDATTRSITA